MAAAVDDFAVRCAAAAVPSADASLGLSIVDKVLLGAFLGGSALVLLLVLALRDTTSPAARAAPRRWLSAVPARAWGERFFLGSSLSFVGWFGYIVVSGVWEHFTPWHYLAVGLASALPVFFLPLLVLKPHASEAALPWWRRYWMRANVWIALFSFVGNHFWTHYFYGLLGAQYTLSAHRLNGVPLCMHLITHAYFAAYHVLTTAALRRWRTSRTYVGLPPWLRTVGTATLTGLLAYATAWTEALTISGFPYYAIANRAWFYTVGSLFYGLYFVVSFPMFARLDEDAPGQDFGPDEARLGAGGEGGGKAGGAASIAAPWSMRRAAVEALAAGMAVTILLDLARLGYSAAQRGVECMPPGSLPWVPADTHDACRALLS